MFAPNWPILSAFLSCETQWRVVARMGELIWLGLDYVAVDVVLRRMKLGDDVFAGLQEMEAVALKVFGEAKQ